MRTLRILPMLIVFVMASQYITAQDDILGALSEAAKALEESRNEAGESADNSAEELSENAWKEAWDKKKEENAEILEAMNTKYLKCLALMVLYLDSYLTLKEEHRIGELQIPACDAYSMQSLSLATSTTIMYCPESIDELSNEEQLAMTKEFLGILIRLKNEDNNAQAQNLQLKFRRIIRTLFNSQSMTIRIEDLPPEEREELEELIEDFGNDSNPGSEFSDVGFLLRLKYIVAFFKPQFILSRTLKIAEERDALGCNG